MAHARGSQAACRSLPGCAVTNAGCAHVNPRPTRAAISGRNPRAAMGLQGAAVFPGRYVQARNVPSSCQLLTSPGLLGHQQLLSGNCTIESRGLHGLCRAVATGGQAAMPPRSPYFDPPGFVDDLTSAAEKRLLRLAFVPNAAVLRAFELQRQDCFVLAFEASLVRMTTLGTGNRRRGWSDWISRQMDRAVKGTPSRNDGPRRQFLNPSKPNTPLVEPVTYKDISWTAFPRQVDVDTGSDSARWAAADKSRDVQDEYCEWSVTRDPVSKLITKVTFTSEGPEYWDYLASVNPDKVLALYQQHISADVKRADLFDRDGKYNRRNKWNATTTRGAMHLIQDSNSLSAEIELAGGSR